MPWQLPFPFPFTIPPPPPPPLALLTAQQEFICIYLYHMPYSCISQIKKVFNLANATQRHF